MVMCALAAAPAFGAALPQEQMQALGGGSLNAVKDGWRLAPTGGDCYWTVPADVAGDQYVTLQVQGGEKQGDELLRDGELIYHNGNPVWFATATFLDKRNGVWTTELRTDSPIKVAAGDELRLSPRLGGKWVGALNLVSTKPEPGPLLVLRYPGPRHEDRVRGEIVFNKTAPAVKVSLKNVQGSETTYKVTTRVMDYFQKLLAEDIREVKLANHDSATFELPFPAAVTDRYRCKVVVVDPQDQRVVLDREVLVDENNGARAKTWLVDGWEMVELPGIEAGEAPPAGAVWQPAGLPSSGGKTNVSWWRKTFTPQPWMKGGRNILHFNRAEVEATVYLNGKQVTKHLGSAPFDVDVTDQLKWEGSNEILVALRNAVSVLTPTELKRTPVTLSAASEVEAPAGHRMKLDEVWLLKEPAAHISDVFVKPSFQNRRLDVDVEAQGLTDGSYTIEGAVEFEGKPVLSLPPVKATASGGGLTTSLGAAWEKPVLWGLGSPNLLSLAVTIKNSQGQPLDQSRLRFGFREFYIQGTSLLLNGVPMKLRAFAMDTDAGMTERMKRDSIRDRIQENLALGGQYACHISSPIYAQIADEIGLPIEFYTTGIHAPTVQKIESDLYWENAGRDAHGIVMGFRDHPSIVVWYISNEFAECAPTVEPAVKRLQTLAKVVAKADPTRIVQSGCDLDLRGDLSVISTHYPVDMHAQAKPKVFMPIARLWRLPGQTFERGMKVPTGQVKTVANVRAGESPITWGEKPILVHETGWVAMFRPFGGVMEFGGDSVYHGPNELTRTFERMERNFAEGHRDAGAALITLWMHLNSWNLLEALPPYEIVPITSNTSWFGGAQVRYDVNVHHDVALEEECRLEWGLRSDGVYVKQGEKPLVLGPTALARETLSFDLPAVQSVRDAALEMRLFGPDGSLRALREMAGRIYPKASPFRKPTGKVVLFDPAGTTQAALKAAGLELPLVLPGTFPTDQATALIIGEGSADDPELQKAAGTIKSFVEGGGTLLVLHQSKMPANWLGLGLPGLSELERGFGFVRSPNEPLLEGFSDADLKYWQPDGRIGSKPYRKPVTGNAKTLVDSSFSVDGLEYSLALEVRLGRGRVLATQLLLADRLEASPVARELMQRLVAGAGRTAPPYAKAAALVRPGGEFDVALTRLGAEADRVKAGDSLDGYQVVLLDGSMKLEAQDAARLKAVADRGGVVVVHRADADQLETMRAWFGPDVKANSDLPPGWKWRAMRLKKIPWLDGLSDADLFWRKPSEIEGANAYYSEDRFALEPLADLVWEIPGGQALTYPAVLTRVDAGQGAWLLDNTRWDVTKVARADRIGAVLLNNLGIGMRGQRPADLSAAGTGKPPGGSKPAEVSAADAASAQKLYNEAVVMLGQGKMAPAVQILKQALAADPKSLPIRLRLAQALTSTSAGGQAEALLKETIAMHPETIELYMQLGRLQEDAGRWQEARAIYGRALEIDINQPPAVQAIERVDRAMATGKKP